MGDEVYIGGRLFDPHKCHNVDPLVDDESTHYCTHDWSIYWGDLPKVGE